MKWIKAAAIFAALAGCNTVNGVGQDISGAAVTVQDWM